MARPTKKAKTNNNEEMSFPKTPMEGKSVPDVTLKARKNGDWLDIKTGEFFADKTVVVFSLPGAFTPTCSSTHLPRYEQLFDLFKANGVDEIVCVSVNDGFVMESWAKDQHAKNVLLFPDGNADFTKAMGMDTDKSAIGFGVRSWRYSMLVKNGTIEKIFPEPVQEGDPFEVSDADTMIKHINPKVEIPPSTVIFTKKGCPYCKKAKELLSAKGYPYDEVITGLGGNVSFGTLLAVSGKTSAPQIFMDGKLIGGSDDLEKYFA
eukprot:maker-scaffold_1-snap-gene-29.48-mRNA-1 protein AED:0.04 eAED:0.04 QI:57/1/1/1/1/1/2/230/262